MKKFCSDLIASVADEALEVEGDCGQVVAWISQVLALSIDRPHQLQMRDIRRGDRVGRDVF